MGNPILVFVHYKIKTGKRAEFIEALKNAKIAECSKEEPGNLKYEVALPIEEEDVVSLLEVWWMKPHSRNMYRQYIMPNSTCSSRNMWKT